MNAPTIPAALADSRELDALAARVVENVVRRRPWLSEFMAGAAENPIFRLTISRAKRRRVDAV